MFKETHKLEGHKRGISSVKFASKANLLASASADKSIRIWSLDGELKLILEGHHTKGISDCAWSPDSRFMCSGADDKNVCVYDITTGKLINVLKGHDNYVMCVTYNPAGNFIASGSYDESIRLWDVRTGKCIRRIPSHSDPVSAVSFNHNGKQIVSGSFDGLCRIFDTSTGQCVCTVFEEQSVPISNVLFAPNGKYILVSSLDSRRVLWDFNKQGVVASYKGCVNTKYCMFAAFMKTTGRHQLVTGSEDNHVYIWDLQTKEIIQKLEGHTDVPIGVDAHPTLPMLASGGHANDRTVRIWESTTGHST